MHSTEKVHDTTLDDENATQCVMFVLVTALYNQPEAFALDLGDDQSDYLCFIVFGFQYQSSQLLGKALLRNGLLYVE